MRYNKNMFKVYTIYNVKKFILLNKGGVVEVEHKASTFYGAYDILEKL